MASDDIAWPPANRQPPGPLSDQLRAGHFGEPSAAPFQGGLDHNTGLSACDEVVALVATAFSSVRDRRSVVGATDEGGLVRKQTSPSRLR